MYTYTAKILRVIDADTMQLQIDLGLDTYRRITVRLYEVNAPERYTEEGKEATQWVLGWISQYAPETCVVETFKDRREKFGRYLVRLYTEGITEAPICLNDALVEAGHAVPVTY